MTELDEVVRQNQLACLPFAKSGRAEAELSDAHPELSEIIERGKRAKIDSFRLQSRLQDEDSYYTNVAKARSLSHDNGGTSPSPQQARQKSLNERPHSSNPLKQKTSTVDLMFEMEDEPDEFIGTGSTLSTPITSRNRSGYSPRLEALSPDLPLHNSTRSNEKEASPLDLDAGISASPTLRASEKLLEDATSPPPPWVSPTFDSSRLTMKEIMAQASSSRKSSLSSGLALKGRDAESTTSSTSAKKSQRERKKQQQQEQPRQQGFSTLSAETGQLGTAVHAASPWQVASTGPRTSLEDFLGATTRTRSSSADKTSSQASNPPLTLRQTISGNASAVRRAASGGPPQQQPTTPVRSVSTPIVAGKTSHSPLVGTSAASPSVRSVRYAPPPAEPSLQLSMADILSQQQMEKDVVKEATAKRSLQEIQEEQAFQEWWDQESKKVQEDEESAARGKTVSPRAGKASAGRGRSRSAGRRGRGRGRGESSSAAGFQSRSSGEAANQEGLKPTRGRGDADRSRGRGSGRGRGTWPPMT